MITEVVSKVVYKLVLPPHWKIHSVFHASLLTPYHKTTMHGPNHYEPPPEIIDGEPEWEVEEILGDRTFGQREEKQYKSGGRVTHWHMIRGSPHQTSTPRNSSRLT